jgi:predicted PurR-regulated permease PerM
MVRNVTMWLANFKASILRESVSHVGAVLLTFYFLFYFLRDCRHALNQLNTFSPFTVSETTRLLNRASDVIHAIFFGIVVTGAIQGALAGGMFWFLGLPNCLSGVWSWHSSQTQKAPALGSKSTK